MPKNKRNGVKEMPIKPMKPCNHPGCPLITHDTYCESHAKLHVDDRPNARDRGYDNNGDRLENHF